MVVLPAADSIPVGSDFETGAARPDAMFYIWTGTLLLRLNYRAFFTLKFCNEPSRSTSTEILSV